MRVERVIPWRRTIAAGDARSRWTSRSGWLVVVEHDGVRGIGECSPLPGFAPDSPDAFAGTHAAALTFALETAALDAIARRRGISLAAALVDHPATRVPLNALVADAASAAAAVARGIHTIKVKVGSGDARAALAPIVTAVPAARLRLDANQTWPLAEVRPRLSALADLPIDYVEEPSADFDHAGPLPLPVALDESLADPDRDRWLDRSLASGAVGALILKPTVLGGFAVCAALAARARAHGVAAIVTHALEGPVGTAACATLALALGGHAPVGLDLHPTLAAWNVGVPHLTSDAVVEPGLPGIGIDIDAALAAAVQREGA